MRLLGSLLPGPREAALPLATSPDYRVLVIRYERIGDMIMATSLIRNIAMALPSGKVDVLATSATAPVLEGNPYVENVFTLNRGSVRSYRDVMKQLRRARHTVMVDGRINNPPVFTSTPLLMYAGRARFRVGARGNKKPRIYNVSVPEWNRVDHYIEGSKQLAVPFGVDPASVDWQPEIFLSPEEHARADQMWKEAKSLVSFGSAEAETGKKLLVNLSASEPKRRWPDGKFIVTLQSARARFPNMPMIVMGLPSGRACKKSPMPCARSRRKRRVCVTPSRWLGLRTSCSHQTRVSRTPHRHFESPRWCCSNGSIDRTRRTTRPVRSSPGMRTRSSSCLTRGSPRPSASC
jgi:hypothetical protein